MAVATKKKISNPFNISDGSMPKLSRRTKRVMYVAINNQRKSPIIEKNPPPPPNLYLPSTYTFYDPNEEDEYNKHKLIKNVTSVEYVRNKEGEMENKEEVGPVEMPFGILDIDLERQKNLFVYMELYPANGSSRFRDKSKAILFERVDITPSSIRDRHDEQLLHFEATRICLGLNKEKLEKYYASAKDPYGRPAFNPIGKSIDQMKHDLFDYAWKHPRLFIEMTPDVAAISKMYIMDGLRKGVLEFNSDKNIWKIYGRANPIRQSAPDKDPMEDMVEYLCQKEGAQYREEIRKQINEVI